MDPIDRQAIHDTVIARYPDSDATQYSVGYADAINDALKDIRYMPSVELEIIRCKDCKHWTTNIGDSELRDNYCNEAMHGFYYRCSGDDFCSRAERRNDG